MLLILLRTLLIYGLIIAALRLMGKKQLGELQPSELVSTILLSNLASISIESPELPLAGSVVPVFLIVAAEITLSAVCVRWRRAATLVTGTPRVVISGGVLDQKTLAQLRYTVDDLLEALRGKDIFELADVEFAIIETNGSISVKKKFAAEVPGNAALQLPPPRAKQPSLPMIVDGEENAENMRLYGISQAVGEEVRRAQHCPRGEVLLLLCNDARETLLIPREPQEWHRVPGKQAQAGRTRAGRCTNGAGKGKKASAQPENDAPKQPGKQVRR